MRAYNISVKELCSYSMLSGSIDNRYSSRGRMTEGIRLHQYVQSKYKPTDLSEYSLDLSAVFDDTLLNISGRADGVLNYKKHPVIEEIKSTSRSLLEIEEPEDVHLAQCKCYAYMYCVENALDCIDLKVTYIYTGEKKDIKQFEYSESFEELKSFFDKMCLAYIDAIKRSEALEEKRNDTIAKIKFPFEFRMYQKETINRIYKLIKAGKNVFMNAPTGSGKTLNALYPAIKAMPYLNNPKVFYLTSKSTQKSVAINAMQILMKKGLNAKVVEITAKEKACKLAKPNCNPIDCEYANRYYDKLRENKDKILDGRNFVLQKDFEAISEEYKMCPFEMSLDFAQWADIIICDYNYVFDPSAALKRFFDDESESADYIFLVDEAHNLPDRSRQMYSAEIYKKDLYKLKQVAPSLRKLNKIADEIIDYFGEWESDSRGKDANVFEDISLDFYTLLGKFTHEADNYLSRANSSDEKYQYVLDMYFNVNRFINMYDIKKESHIFYYDNKGDFLKLFCTDAGEYLKAILKKGKSGVFFSATFTPLEYYREILGGSSDDDLYSVASSFDKDNFKIAVDTSISTTYAKRALHYKDVADRIHDTIMSKRGNYIVFFPSYLYLNAVYEEYINKYEDDNILLQERNMNEKKRNEFLSKFTVSSAVTAFAVIGGVFGEAVDLVGDKLIGTVICGVSLPMICTERELIKEHYDKSGKSGFDYAYVYPGMNKVLQAMGRVIRTQDDRGCAVLLDERFRYSAYRKCFPPHYDNMVFVNNSNDLKKYLRSSGFDEFFDDGFYEE